MPLLRNPEIRKEQAATMTIQMTCIGWDLVGVTLAGIQTPECQNLADAICKGLVDVGYYQSVKKE